MYAQLKTASVHMDFLMRGNDRLKAKPYFEIGSRNTGVAEQMQYCRSFPVNFCGLRECSSLSGIEHSLSPL